MNFIDEKFKDENPEITVQKIIEKLSGIGITIEEVWNDSKIENCCSVMIKANGRIPTTNGKGISKAFARASAYGEFMERFQSGLFFYKYQGFERDDSVFLHSFAPDKKYMTKSELVESGKGGWMEPIVKKYGISEDQIADHCVICAGSDKVLTLPYYSLFDDEYVYLPASFVEYMYASNGCCVGNTREEAWVHALSEIFERNSSVQVIKSGKPVPIIPREKLKDFKVVNAILDKIESTGMYDIQILDYSCGKKYPIVGTRIINKKTKGYIVNVGADPVFEIAVQRTLTEIFQGRNLDNFTSRHNGAILKKLSDINMADNVINQLENGNGLYTADFFADTDAPDDVDSFVENSDKNNSQLMSWVLGKYKDMGLKVYVRNNSFLGLPCYMFVVPGFSEARGERLKEVVPSYYFADRAATTLKDIKSADIAQLSELLLYNKMIANFINKKNDFRQLSGLPLTRLPANTTSLHFAYAALKLKNYALFDVFMNTAIKCTQDEATADYLKAVKQWAEFEKSGIKPETAMAVIKKFYFADSWKRLEENLKNETLLDEFMVECKDCEKCAHKDNCCYDSIRNIIKCAGDEYAKFTKGQDKENFAF